MTAITLRKEGSSQIDDLSFHRKKLKKRANETKISRRQEKENERVEINEIQKWRTTKKINKTESWVLKKISKMHVVVRTLTRNKTEDTNYSYEKQKRSRHSRDLLSSATIDIKMIIKEYYKQLMSVHSNRGNGKIPLKTQTTGSLKKKEMKFDTNACRKENRKE